MKYCLKCGKELSNQAKFCTKCGAEQTYFPETKDDSDFLESKPDEGEKAIAAESGFVEDTSISESSDSIDMPEETKVFQPISNDMLYGNRTETEVKEDAKEPAATEEPELKKVDNSLYKEKVISNSESITSLQNEQPEEAVNDTAKTSAQSIKYCGQCGKPNDSASKFCNYCGTSLPILDSEISNETAMHIQPEPSPKVAAAAKQPESQRYEEATDSKKPAVSVEPSTKERTKVSCLKCETVNETSSKYCTHCGSSLLYASLSGDVVKRSSSETTDYTYTQNSSPYVYDEWKQRYAEHFDRMYPHLKGCVPATLGTRLLRSFVMNITVVGFVLVDNLIEVLFPNRIEYLGGSYTLGMSGFGAFIMVLIYIGFFLFEYSLMKKNGMNYGDYATKTKWIDITTGEVITKNGILKQLLLFDAVPLIIMVISFLGSGSISTLSGALGFLTIIGLFSSIYSTVLGIGSIIAFFQVYDDKISHRCWIDKISNVIVIDTKKGRDPLE